ncbi:MAG: efflux RND transporter permease subunit [Clostridia bacterium]|nr:efflux RND transporter permease subunit [Clostridia bacterium]
MLTKYSVKKPFTIFVAVVIVAVFGLVAVYKMTPDLFPSINTPYAVVATTFPGASAEEVEVQVTDPIEQQLATLSNVKNVSSMSADNYSVVSLEFTDKANMDALSVDIRDKLDQIESQFPETASTPLVLKINLDMMPVTVAAVGVKGKTPAQVSTFVKEKIKSKLEGTEGVASVNYIGMVDEGYQIVLSQKDINKINNNVADAITSQFNKGEGELKSGINKAKSGSRQINNGKNKIKDGSDQAASAISQLEESKKGLLKFKKDGPELLQQYESAPDEIKPEIEKIMQGMGFKDAKDFKEQLDNVDVTIESVNDAIHDIQSKVSAGTFIYSDLSGQKGTVDAVVSQLQMALSQVESQKQAAIDSADMTGVITMDNVTAILNAQNFSMPAGYVTDGEADILVSVGNKIKDLDELENLTLFDLGIDGLDPIKVKDIATVSYAADDSESYAKINGENGILLMFTKQSTYATATVADNINDTFAELQDEYKNLNFINFVDQGEYIHTVISSVFKDLLLGALFAILILLFFLRDIRPTVITAISIPVSVVFALALMYFSGVTMNLISMSGLAIGVGMLVDNSIVVIENTYRLRSMGYSAVQSAVSGASQVAGAITASTLTTICVFVPIVFVDGMTKELFTDLALTVTYSLLASLLIALTFVPAVSKGLLVKNTKKTVLSQEGRVIAKYKNAAAWALMHKKRIVLVALALLLASTGVLLIRGFEFMPEMSSDQISASIKTPDGSTLEETAEINDKISDKIRKIDGVESVGVMLATNLADTVGMGSGEADTENTTMYITLEKGMNKQGKVVGKKLDNLAKEYNCEIITSASMDMTSLAGGNGVSMNLYSDDVDKLRIAGEKIEANMRDMKSLENVSDVEENSTDELIIEVNKNTAMKNGLTVAQVYQQVAAKLSKDKTATTLTDDGGNKVDVNVSTSGKNGVKMQNLLDMKLVVDKKDGTKEKVLLSSISTVHRDASLSVINHANQKRTLAVSASVKDGYNITKVTSDVKKMINDKELVPEGVEIEYAGGNKEIMHSLKQMILMMLVGMILVYLIMVAQFQSLRSPFIIIFTLPLAFTGGLLALLITNNVLSVIGMMGFVMLVGIVVNNGIVLVDCINRFRLEGMDTDSAIIEAGAVRMRPVLMTASTTILGLLPLAFGIGQGSEMVQPVAIVTVGGLIYATITTLFVIPIMYKWLSRKHMEKIDEEELEIVNV